LDASARSELNDAMARLAVGDRAAFDVVFATLRPMVEHFSRRMLGPGADAADAAQQAMLKLFEQASDYERGRDAAAWALAICAWECRTVRTRRARRREVGIAEAGETSDERDPERATIGKQLESAAREILGQLSEADRETLLAGERGADVSASTFRKRRERAVARLRQAWRRVYGTD
jgi:RNA polymerase sigma-70 factor (ECF subfamily)